ncbi:MAG TPA: GGDEF domain-containing protein [Acidimicrobiales bacterium]|nr:GGDEF domain-containing protein [Acidimicrobiales bacterium]
MSRARVHANQWATRELVADALGAMDEFEQAGDRGGQLDAASVAAAHAACLGELSLASELAMSCVVGLRGLPDDVLRAEVTNRLGIFCYSFRDFDRSVEQFEMSLAAAERSGKDDLVGRALYNLVNALLLYVHDVKQRVGGELVHGSWWGETLARAEVLLDKLAGAAGSDRVRQLRVSRLRWRLLYERGQPERALAGLREGQASLLEKEEESKYDLALLEARCLRALGRSTEAVGAARRARDAAASSEDDQELVIALRELVAAEHEARDFGAALTDALELIERLNAVHRRHTAQVVEQVWARAVTELDRPRQEPQPEAASWSPEEDAWAPVVGRHLLERALSAQEKQTTDFSLVMVDIDHFKQMNETFGRELGYQVLRAVGQLLAADVRTGQAVLRCGRDGFVLALPAVPLPAAVDLAERLKQKVAAFAWDVFDGRLQVTVSTGVASGRPLEWRKVLAAAGRALSAAKRGRKEEVRAKLEQ